MRVRAGLSKSATFRICVALIQSSCRLRMTCSLPQANSKTGTCFKCQYLLRARLESGKHSAQLDPRCCTLQNKSHLQGDWEPWCWSSRLKGECVFVSDAAGGDVSAGLVYHTQRLSSTLALKGHDEGRSVYLMSFLWLFLRESHKRWERRTSYKDDEGLRKTRDIFCVLMRTRSTCDGLNAKVPYLQYGTLSRDG